jgi:hypothetical protein
MCHSTKLRFWMLFDSIHIQRQLNWYKVINNAFIFLSLWLLENKVDITFIFLIKKTYKSTFPLSCSFFLWSHIYFKLCEKHIFKKFQCYGSKPGPWGTLEKCSTTELHLQFFQWHFGQNI